MSRQGGALEPGQDGQRDSAPFRPRGQNQCHMSPSTSGVGGAGGGASQIGVNVPADTHNVRLEMQMAKLAASPPELRVARRAGRTQSGAESRRSLLQPFLPAPARISLATVSDFCSKSKHFCLFS